MHHQIKKYVVRVFLVNFFSLLYLIGTPSLDFGFFSIQSLFYSINIYCSNLNCCNHYFIYFLNIIPVYTVNVLTLVFAHPGYFKLGG